MGSRSFCLALSGDCKCASWLAASTREAGCGIFMPVDCWASGSSKLDLEKDCLHVFRVEHKAFKILLLVTPEQVLIITFMCVYINIFTHTLFQINFTTLYLVTLWNILSKQCTGDIKIKSVPSEMSHFFNISHLPFYPFLFVTYLSPKTPLLLTRTDVLDKAKLLEVNTTPTSQSYEQEPLFRKCIQEKPSENLQWTDF